MGQRGLCLSLLLAAMMCATTPGSARPWQGAADPSPKFPAQYYSKILDTHKSDEIVMVIWLSAPFVGPEIERMPGMQAALDQYVVVGALRVRREGDKILLDYGPAQEARDQNDNPLKRVPGSDVPAEIKNLVVFTKAMMASAESTQQSGETPVIPGLGQKFRFMAFEAGSVKSCAKGQLRVRYAGETYTYDTPLPGCPAH